MDMGVPRFFVALWKGEERVWAERPFVCYLVRKGLSLVLSLCFGADLAETRCTGRFIFWYDPQQDWAEPLRIPAFTFIMQRQYRSISQSVTVSPQTDLAATQVRLDFK